MRTFVFAGLLCLGLTACYGTMPNGPSYQSVAESQFIPSNHKAADALIGQLSTKPGFAGNTLIVATLVNVDALETSSTLGRVISEQIATRFSQHGYKVVDMRIRNNIYIKKDEGELLLSREIRDLAQQQSAQAVIVGTYGESAEVVFINIKVVDPAHNHVLAVHDYALPRDNIVKSMLKTPQRSY